MILSGFQFRQQEPYITIYETFLSIYGVGYPFKLKL